MPYIGNNLATQFQAFATQTITGDGSTGYTLDRAVANGKELLVYINNVKQEEGSGKSYTASGTTITFSEAVASGDSCYVVFLGSAQQTVTAPAGSIVSSQFSSADLVLPKTVTIGSAGAEDTKLVFDGNAQDYHVGLDDSADKLTVGVGSTLGTNTAMSIDSTGRILTPLRPAFRARIAGSSSAEGTQGTLVFETEDFDIGGNYDTSNGRFTAPVAGVYWFAFSSLTATNTSGDTLTSGDLYHVNFFKNGSQIAGSRHYEYVGAVNQATVHLIDIVNLAASDYIQVNVGSEFTYSQNNEAYDPVFCGYLLG